jgi:uncharacterized membrane protein
MEIAINFAFFGILIGAFVRLNSLVNHDGLALSKTQMFFHTSAFAIISITAAVFAGGLIQFKKKTPLSLDNASGRINYL